MWFVVTLRRLHEMCGAVVVVVVVVIVVVVIVVVVVVVCAIESVDICVCERCRDV